MHRKMCITSQFSVQVVLDGDPARENIFISVIFLVFAFYQACFFGTCRILAQE
jgi:hypothetical protein